MLYLSKKKISKKFPSFKQLGLSLQKLALEDLNAPPWFLNYTHRLRELQPKTCFLLVYSCAYYSPCVTKSIQNLYQNRGFFLTLKAKWTEELLKGAIRRNTWKADTMSNVCP